MEVPSLNEFLEKCDQNIEWSEYQKNLAVALIDYEKTHFSGGRGSGRTMVINAVMQYFEKYYPYVEKEI